MIRQQFPFLEESDLYLQTVYDLAKTMTPVEEIPILMDFLLMSLWLCNWSCRNLGRHIADAISEV